MALQWAAINKGLLHQYVAGLAGKYISLVYSLSIL